MESAEKSSPQQTKDKIKNHPRRFTDEQIKSLESIFKKESKLEPRKKLEIARDLDLKPRQVAIWFQNKRARWRSKQIEHEYNLLRSNYDSLSLRFEELKAEKMSLEMQLRELSNLIKNLENIDSSDHPTEESNEKKIIGNRWWMKREEGELEISQTWHNLSSDDGLFDHSSENSNWWVTNY